MGKMHMSSKCTQHVITGFQAPSPPVSKERSRRSASLISWVGDDFEWALDIDSADESGSAAIPEFAQAALDHVGVPGMT